MLAGVKLASRLADKSERKMIALLGDMREL
jgi:hypothetical protein